MTERHIISAMFVRGKVMYSNTNCQLLALTTHGLIHLLVNDIKQIDAQSTHI